MISIRYSCEIDGKTEDHEIVVRDPVVAGTVHGDYQASLVVDGGRPQPMLGVTPMDSAEYAFHVAKAYTVMGGVSHVIWRSAGLAKASDERPLGMLNFVFSYDIGGSAEEHQVSVGDPERAHDRHELFQCMVSLDSDVPRPVHGLTPLDAAERAVQVARAFTAGPGISNLSWG